MNGAESLVHTLLASGVDTCFANPGTSEMHFVAALDRISGMHCVLCLFEGVATGAADGYARMAGKPAATLLHCGPGMANGLANLHNGRRAATMMVNCVGDQATHHRPLDAPLTADAEGWARGVSAWVRTVSTSGQVGADAAAAVQAARTAPGAIATLILPSDTCWNPGGVPAAPLAVPPTPKVAPQTVADIARLLRRGEPSMLVLVNDALRAGPLADAHRIAAATGARLWAPTANRRIERGAGRHPIERIPYPVDVAVQALAGMKHVVLVGAGRPPMGFFAYPNKPGLMAPPDAIVHVLARPEQDLPAALAALADELGAPAVPPPPGEPRPEPSRGTITPESFAASLAALLPEGAIVVDEGVTVGTWCYRACRDAPPHDWINNTGGAIGVGIPLSTGAAIGAPGRRVITLQADGSAMYTLQGLWTQAREGLDVTTIVLANRKYAILLGELANVGANPGRVALDMLDLGRPDLDFVRLGEGMGVPGARAETIEQFNDLFAATAHHRGPFLIELRTP
jgi:acetolactate synthase-1/2/3 large subunit